MKEFNKWFEISFNYKGKDFERTIPISKVEVIAEEDIWYYYFDINVNGECYTVEVYGTYDGDVRTSGEDKYGNSVAFGINILDEENNVQAYIDDIDIIDCD